MLMAWLAGCLAADPDAWTESPALNVTTPFWFGNNIFRISCTKDQ